MSGTAYLDDVLPASSDHSGIEIKFIDVIQQDTVAVATTDSLGNFSIGVPPGFYLLRWEKYGYIPFEIGGYALSSNDVLQTVTLLPGFVQDVCGNVSGVWPSGSVYHVLCDITVPQGDTLTIENGVNVKFSPGTGLVANGTLNILGNDSSKVVFTSREPTPLPGDWDNVELYGFMNNMHLMVLQVVMLLEVHLIMFTWWVT